MSKNHLQPNRKSFKTTQKYNMNYVNSSLFVTEAKLNSFSVLFSMFSGGQDYLLPIWNIEYHISLQYQKNT